jgi:diguanylate cyclase (GGDEF)-like protein
MRLARDIAEAKASNDGLTGLYTHAYFVKLLQIEIEKFQIYGLPVGLIMLDVDKFKSINDEYGHVAGDKILQEVAKTVKSTTRSTDICARYGGEEFSVLMPSVYAYEEKPQPKTLESFVSEIRNLAERIRMNVENIEIRLADGKIVKVTVSIGISTCHSKREQLTPTALLEKADAALYTAKETGRNRIVIDKDSVPPA